MAILTTLDRLTRTAVPARCTAVGLAADAATLTGLAVIDRAARVTSAGTTMRSLEGRISASWLASRDRFWSARTIRAQLVNSTEISEFNSASAAEKLLFKTALRVCEYLACQAAAGA